MSIIIYMSVHTEFIIPNQVVVLKIVPSVFLVLLRLLEASNCSDGLLLFWHVIFFTLNLNSELWLIRKWLRSYGCDSTGTHRALPEEGCDVKEVMAFAFMKVITTLYIILDLMVEVFIREKQTLRFVDA